MGVKFLVQAIVIGDPARNSPPVGCVTDIVFAERETEKAKRAAGTTPVLMVFMGPLLIQRIFRSRDGVKSPGGDPSTAKGIPAGAIRRESAPARGGIRHPACG